MRYTATVEDFRQMSHKVALDILCQLKEEVDTLEAKMKGSEWEEFKESRRVRGYNWFDDVYNQIVFARREVSDALRRIDGETVSSDKKVLASRSRVAL